MGAIGAGIGAATGVASAVGGKNSENQASANSQAQEQLAQTSQNQLMTNIGNTTNQYNQSYSPLVSPTSSGFGSELSGASGQLGSLSSILTQAGLDPSVISQITGINSNQLSQNAISNDQNTSGTNLAGATPGASSFYQNEMQNGINPQYAQNAQNQLQQNQNQQIAQAKASAAPGQNVNANIQSIQNAGLTNSANLAGNLAGQNQQIEQQGASGLLSSATNLDSQKQGMLQSAATAGNALNQQQISNLSTSANAGSSILSALQSFIGQGLGAEQTANSELGGVSGTAATSAASMQNQAQQYGASAANGLGSAASNIGNLFGTTGMLGGSGSTSTGGGPVNLDLSSLAQSSGYTGQ
jgi:hypothetical protein